MSDTATKICAGSCAAIVIVLVMSLFLALPITELAFGNHYKGNDAAYCNSTINVSVPTWLIVDGSIGIVFVMSLFLFISAFVAKTFCGILPLIVFILSGMFKFAWLIVGSVLFWRDCYHVMPDSLNSMMWASLIIGYIYVLTSTRAQQKD